MTELAKAPLRKPLILWSLLCAAAIVASGLLQDYTGAPNAWLWLTAIWTVGFVHWSRK